MPPCSYPNSATAQFFINHKGNDFLNYAGDANPGYAVFGRTVEGMEVVDAIAAVKTTTRQGMQDVPVEPVTITKAMVLGAEKAAGDTEKATNEEMKKKQKQMKED